MSLFFLWLRHPQILFLSANLCFEKKKKSASAKSEYGGCCISIILCWAKNHFIGNAVWGQALSCRSSQLSFCWKWGFTLQTVEVGQELLHKTVQWHFCPEEQIHNELILRYWRKWLTLPWFWTFALLVTLETAIWSSVICFQGHIGSSNTVSSYYKI